MSIADKLRKVLEIKNDIKTALEAQGVEVTDDFSTYATEIASIETGSGGGSTEPEEPEFVYVPPTKPVVDIPVFSGWEKPSDWIDLKAILDDPENVIEGYPYRIAQLVYSEDATSYLSNDYYNPRTCKIRTSDGGNYSNSAGSGWAGITHTWAEGTSGYRWVIHYYDTQSIGFTNILPGCLHIVIDGAKVRNYGCLHPTGSVLVSYNWSGSNYIKEIRAIESINGGKVLCYKSGRTETYKNYTEAFSGFKNLEYLSDDIFDQTHMESCSDFSRMFYDCNSLYRIPQLYTTAGTNFSGIFGYCSLIKTIPSIDTTLGENFEGMFGGCSSLREVPALTTTSGTIFSNMFNYCTSLKIVHGIDITNATETDSLFWQCGNLQYIGGRLDLSNHIRFESNNFEGCYALNTIEEIKFSDSVYFQEAFSPIMYNLQYIGKADFSGTTSVSHLQQFSGLTGIGEITGTDTKTSFAYMFCNCNALQYLPDFDTSCGTDFCNMFEGCSSLRKVPNIFLDNANNIIYMFSGCSSLREVPYFETANVTSFEWTFANCYSLKKVPLYNTSAVTSFINTFYGCSSLREIPYFDTGQAQSLGYMFQGCSLIESVPDFDTRNCADFNGVFYSCYCLKNVPNFNYSIANAFSSMFNGCISLTSIPVIDTSRAYEMSWMFAGCTGLTEIPNITIPTENCNMQGMFSGCSNIKSLPFTSIPISFDCSQIFDGCTSLESIPELVFNNSNGTITNVTRMFANCKSLKSLPTMTNFNWDWIMTANSVFMGSAIESLPELVLPNVQDIAMIVADCPNLKEFSIICTGYEVGQSYGIINENNNLQKLRIQIDNNDTSGLGENAGVKNLTLSLMSTSSQQAIPNSCTSVHFEGSTVNYPISVYTNSVLKDISFSGETMLCADWNLSESTMLTKKSLLNVLNALNPDHEGGTLILGETYLAKLTEEEKAFATNKGWQLA